jgi:hypothetical protein
MLRPPLTFPHGARAPDTCGFAEQVRPLGITGALPA